jgi:hypothetical protein
MDFIAFNWPSSPKLILMKDLGDKNYKNDNIVKDPAIKSRVVR